MDDKATAYVLTEEYNDYDQYGEYFVAVFATKPTHEQLTRVGVEQHRLKHVLDGGGRQRDECHWFNLQEAICQ